MQLAGKVAIVTGSGSGIGRAIALRFAEEGATVVCADVSGAESEVAEHIGPPARAVRVDVTSAADVARMIDGTVREFGRLDVLCNNAGDGGPHGPLADYDDALFDRLVALNLKSVFLGMKHALPVMLRAGSGSIVNTASVAGLVGWAGLAVYSATKGGVVQLTRSAALDYTATGVRINALCPGMTYTGQAGAGARRRAAARGRVAHADETVGTLPGARGRGALPRERRVVVRHGRRHPRRRRLHGRWSAAAGLIRPSARTERGAP